VFARVITTEIGPDGIDGVVRIAQDKLPGASGQPGFAGFYLLADRKAGRLMTISLWSSFEDVVAAEEQAARLRGRTAQSAGVATPDVDIYEVEVRALPAWCSGNTPGVAVRVT
jgi:heme-degrading monooxygenase HmoA